MKKQLLFVGMTSFAMVCGNFVIAPSIQALTLTQSNKDFCDIKNFIGSSQCGGPFDGNDSATAVNNLSGLFGFTDWTQIGKLDAKSGIQNNLIAVGVPDAQGNQTWSFHGTFDPTSYINVAFAVKGSNSFIGYLWDGFTTAGTFKTLGLINNGGKTPDLSHLSVYTRGVVVKPPTNEPLPPVVVPPLPIFEEPKSEDNNPPTVVTEPPIVEPQPENNPSNTPAPPEDQEIVSPPPVEEEPIAEFDDPEIIEETDSTEPETVPTPAAVLPAIAGIFASASRRRQRQ